MDAPTTVQDSTLSSQWTNFLQDSCQNQVQQAALAWPEIRSVEVPFKQIELRDPQLADYILSRPSHALRVGESALYQIDVTVDPKPRLRLRIIGLPESCKTIPRQLRAEHLGKLLALEGLVKKVTEVRPQVLEAAFECKACGNIIHVPQDDDFVQEPVQCDACEKSGNIWRVREEMSRFVDHQKVEIQESPEGLRGGAQPERLTIHLRDDLVHGVSPGDRVSLNGVLVTEARRAGSQKRVEFNKVLDGLSIEHQEREFQEIVLDEEDEEMVIQLSQDPDIYNRFVRSFAPTIFGHAMVKEALIMSLFGGVAKHYKDGSRTRGDIHVLLVGDPGVAKSQLLRYLSKLAPRAIFTSGKSASAAGLTAAAVKDEFGEGQWTLEAGALVMADQGIVCIDELDKMSSQDQSSMHQAMEQQEISISKAGVSATLKSRCAVIGAANPKLGRFDKFDHILDQINMPPALRSRFDLIFSLRDQPNREEDTNLARHILRTHQAGEVHEHRLVNPGGAFSQDDEEHLLQAVQPEISADLFRNYVAYAKRHIVPVMTQEAVDMIREYYVDLRNGNDESFGFTARQLEAFVRLAEASARLRLSQEATVEDAKRAIRIVDFYLKSVGIDQETGRIDLDVINTGVSHSQQDRMHTMLDIVRSLSAESEKGYAREEDIIEEAGRKGIREPDARKSLDMHKKNGSVFAKGGHGTYAPL